MEKPMRRLPLKIRLPFLLFFNIFVLLFFQEVLATTIIPFPNLGEMAKASQAVVLARADGHFEWQQNNSTSYRTRFTVLHTAKGPMPTGTAFETQAWRQRIGSEVFVIWGDPEFIKGRTYLLFLDNKNGGSLWQPVMLAYGVFEKRSYQGSDVLVPSKQSLELSAVPRPDGIVPEPMAVYFTEPLIKKLEAVVNNHEPWQGRSAKAPMEPASFYLDPRAAPSHCTFLMFSGTPFRFTGLPSDDIEFYSEDDGETPAPSYSVHAQVSDAITDMESSYTGINFTYLGTLNYTPLCDNGSPATAQGSSNFSSTIATRQGIVVYNDPCSQITDLSSCSGTLAIGGLFGSGTHTYDGISWFTGTRGFVVVNDGCAACLSATDFKIMLIHELTHTLGIDHISTSPPGGTANMNPFCCNTITSLDQDCVDYSYAPALPVELIHFNAAIKGARVHLTWQTVSEINNSHFTIERSLDGIRFDPIATVPGAGNSSGIRNYEHLDNNAFAGPNYYRLRQTDFDGKFTFSRVAAIEMESDGNTFSIIQNPVAGEMLEMTLQLKDPGLVSVEIFDLNGLPVAAQNFETAEKRNYLVLSLEWMPAGIYFAKLKHQGKVETKKFLKK